MDLSGWVGDCRCGILYAPMFGGGRGLVFAGLFSLTSSPCPSPYSLERFVLRGVLSASGVFLCVRVCRLGAFGFLQDREQVREM